MKVIIDGHEVEANKVEIVYTEDEKRHLIKFQFDQEWVDISVLNRSGALVAAAVKRHPGDVADAVLD